MSKLIGLICIVMVLAASDTPDRERFERYKEIKAYEVRPGFIVIPNYTTDGQVCEIGLERLHYSPDKIWLDAGFGQDEVEQIFEEIVPADERGAKSTDFGAAQFERAGNSLTTSIEFENVSIQIYGKASGDSKHGGTIVNDVAASVRWKKRKCQ